MENLTTTIEWHLAENGLPKKSGKYLIVHPNGSIMTLGFSANYKKFNSSDFMDAEYAEKYALPCVYWAEYPNCFSYSKLAKYREEE